MNADAYLSQLRALLPPGAAWTLDPDADMSKLLRALAQELARLEGRTADLLDEADPHQAMELLADWERNAGLPDPCTGPLETLQQRRAALIGKLTGRGDQSRAFFIALAEALGYQVTITEFRPFYADRGAAGAALGTEESMFVWRVNAPEVTVTSFRVGRSAVGEPLRTWGNQQLECALSRVAPAHTDLLFGYGG